jgi:hypothetical protein
MMDKSEMRGSSPIARLKSILHAGILMLLWGTSMTAVELFVLGSGRSLRGRLLHDPLFLVSSTLLMLLGVGAMTTSLAALRGMRVARRMPWLQFWILAFYGLSAFGTFTYAYAWRAPLPGKVALVFVAAILTALLIALAAFATRKFVQTIDAVLLVERSHS